MQMHLRRMLVTTLWLLSCASIGADFEQPLMGPLLGFKGTEAMSSSWNVSVLYLLREASHYPAINVDVEGHTTSIKGKAIGTVLNHAFVRYDMTLTQAKEELAVRYEFPGQHAHTFFVPAKGRAADKNKIMYQSCNGYQYTADRDRVQGISTSWKVVNQENQKHHFSLHIGGGDLIYADGIDFNKKTGWATPTDGTAFGIFALPLIKDWLSLPVEERDTAPFTQEMKKAVTQFYFEQYISHFNEDEFREALATIASTYQYDDHDIHDGAGSYPKNLQNSPVLKGIREIATWFVFVAQHQLAETEVTKHRFTARGHNYVHVLDNVALVFVDTRTERTEDTIVTPKSYVKIFSMLEDIPESVEHVMLILSVPLVYPSSNTLESAVKVASSIPILGSALNMIPGLKNSFGLFELADDGRDGWGHYSHKAERNELVLKLQEFGYRTHRRVTLLGGDVHLGGAGKIYPDECGLGDCSDRAIYQAFSSPIGNAPVGKKAAKAIGLKACHGECLAGDCSMCAIQLEPEEGGKAQTLLSARNFLMFGVEKDLSMSMRWSAEMNGPGEAHTIYGLKIPRSEWRIYH